MRSRITSYKTVFSGLALASALAGSWSVASLTGGGVPQPAALITPATISYGSPQTGQDLHAQLARLQASAAARAAQAAEAARAAQLQQAVIQQASPTPSPAVTATQSATPPPAPQTPPPVTPSGSPQQYAAGQMGNYGWGQDQMSCLIPLWNQESGWNVYATNPTSYAYGIPQALPGDKMASAGPDWRTSYVTQINWGLGYIKGNYGNPCGAWAHEQADGWY